MIIGIGNDLCNIERIQRALDRFGEKFERRVFTPYEIAKARVAPSRTAGKASCTALNMACTRFCLRSIKAAAPPR